MAEACRQRGLDRTSFYEWKRRSQTQGLEGLKDPPPTLKSHPQTTPPETVQRIRALALEHPAYGCNRHEALPPGENRGHTHRRSHSSSYGRSRESEPRSIVPRPRARPR